MSSFRVRPAVSWPEVVARASVQRADSPIEGLVVLVDALRAGRRDEAADRTRALCEYLEQHPDDASLLGADISKLVGDFEATSLLIESGVPGNLGFASELFRRIERHFVPEIDPPQDLRSALRAVFGKDDDYRWVNEVPDDMWIRLLRALGMGDDAASDVDRELAAAMRILSHHVASLGLQPEISHKLPEVDDFDSPFLALPDHVVRYLSALGKGRPDEVCQSALAEALGAARTCRRLVERLREEKSHFGTSLHLTSLSLRLRALLDRLEHLLELTTTTADAFRAHIVALFREVVHAENTRNHVRPHLRASAELLAYQVTEHAAKKGAKYITSGVRDYWMFYAASLGGGFIVAMFAMLKILAKQWDLPVGIEALVYGINYSICFVVIYLSGAALATKQPAMTANTLARSLDGDGEAHHVERLETLVVRVWRSQFISFAGNLSMALPAAFVISWLYFRYTGEAIATEAVSQKMLSGLHPWRSGALAYAGVAGFFLFAAGLIGGWVDNRNVYLNLPQRVARHPRLIQWLGAERAERVGSFLDRNLGILAGNVVLGFCLGSAGSIGEILGLPFDIRHIAFSSAELGVSVETLGSAIPRSLLVQAMLGVTLIGLVNFVVSFGLSLGMALESRRVTFKETRLLLRHLAKSFFSRPLAWFFPPRKGVTPSV